MERGGKAPLGWTSGFGQLVARLVGIVPMRLDVVRLDGVVARLGAMNVSLLHDLPTFHGALKVINAS